MVKNNNNIKYNYDLVNFYSECQISVLCGTFTKIGGHNILEPIRARSYTIIGPYDFKIKDLTNLFIENNAVTKVYTIDELISKIKEAIKSKDLREKQIQNGLKLLEENLNAIEYTKKEIVEILQRI